MTFVVTPLYTLPLCLIFLILWMRVSSLRSATGISFGDGNNPELLHRMRQHGNFIEWVPLVLVVMTLAEGMGAPAIYLHVSGILLVVGRIAHPFGLRPGNAGHPLRYLGNGTNILALLSACLSISVHLLGL